MRFAFTDDQLAFRDAARDLLEKECPPHAVRAAWDNEDGRVPGLWEKLVEMGLFELDEVDSVLVLEETGRACVPEPVVEAWACGMPNATLSGDFVWLGRRTSDVAKPRVAFFRRDLLPFLMERTAPSDLNDAALQVREALRSRGASFATDLVRATVGERRASFDGSRRLFDVRPTDDVLPLEVAVVGDRAAVAAAAQLVGLAQHMLDMSVAYVSQREQFGKPVGSFQAVKHHLADAALRLEFARPCVHRAAWSMEPTDVSLAKAQASEAALLAARKALQVHGAIGYTVEYDLHMWMKRAWALAACWGDAAWHRARITDAVLKGTTDA